MHRLHSFGIAGRGREKPGCTWAALAADWSNHPLSFMPHPEPTQDGAWAIAHAGPLRACLRGWRARPCPGHGAPLRATQHPSVVRVKCATKRHVEVLD